MLEHRYRTDPLDVFMKEVEVARNLPPHEFQAKMETLLPLHNKIEGIDALRIGEIIFDPRHRYLENREDVGKLVGDLEEYIRSVKGPRPRPQDKSMPGVPVSGSGRESKKQFTRRVKSVLQKRRRTMKRYRKGKATSRKLKNKTSK
jgi:hypothetical protein